MSTEEQDSGCDVVKRGLVRLFELEDAQMRARWKRSLPLPETITDRWARAAALGFGSDTSVYHLSYIYGDVSVGEHTWIGPYTLLDGSGGLRIGSWCSISAGVQIYSHSTVKWAVSGGRASYEHRPTAIGDCCFIGPQSVIAMGVTIGDRCVVGAHSFINDDVPPDSIVFGAPGRIVGSVEITDEGVAFRYEPDVDTP